MSCHVKTFLLTVLLVGPGLRAERPEDWDLEDWDRNGSLKTGTLKEEEQDWDPEDWDPEDPLDLQEAFAERIPKPGHVFTGGGGKPWGGRISVPPGPLKLVTEVSKHDLIDVPQPVILHNSELMQVFTANGLNSFGALKENYGNSSLHVGEETQDFEKKALNLTETTVAEFVDSLLHPNGTAPRLSEMGGRIFFLDKPKLYMELALIYEKILPEGFKEQWQVDHDDLDDLKEASENADSAQSELALWSGSQYTYQLHADYDVGNLLTHLEGRKRITLYPPEQAHLLYLERPANTRADSNWEAVSYIEDPNELSRRELLDTHPLFTLAEPLVVDLQPGDSILIPCGWAHIVEYFGPALSVAATIFPDWLDEAMEKDPNFSPRGCSAWLPHVVEGPHGDVSAQPDLSPSDNSEHLHLWNNTRS